jgi:hypothetical protein
MHIFVGDEHPATIRAEQANDMFQQHAFAGTTAANNRQDVAGFE